MKKICLVLSLIVSNNLFAVGSFEGILNVPLGGSVSFRAYTFDSSVINTEAQTEIKNQTKPDMGFEIGVNLQLGYRFDFDNSYSLSLLSDIGYAYDFLGYMTKVDGDKYFNWFHLHSISIGVLPKFNINNISVGIGGGVKLPLKGDYYESDGKKAYQFQDGNTYYASINYEQLKENVFKSLVIPYIKLTFDYSLKVHQKLALNFGLYTGYDFPIQLKENNNYEKSKLSSFNFGLQLGLKFSENK